MKYVLGFIHLTQLRKESVNFKTDQQKLSKEKKKNEKGKKRKGKQSTWGLCHNISRLLGLSIVRDEVDGFDSGTPNIWGLERLKRDGQSG